MTPVWSIASEIKVTLFGIICYTLDSAVAILRNVLVCLYSSHSLEVRWKAIYLPTLTPFRIFMIREHNDESLHSTPIGWISEINKKYVSRPHS